ncbi:DUF1553 domain-containing protein [Verrucomicrobia bacterium]|nr:DUF1553 domain-containing protein [Verrucomicrobiota bacterium]
MNFKTVCKSHGVVTVKWLVVLLLAQTPLSAEVEFNRDIRSILSENCYHCHGPDKHERKAGLRLDTSIGALDTRKGSAAIDPINLSQSELLKRIQTTDPDDIMPPSDSLKKLTSDQKELLEQWVLAGAEYEEHWAFVPPVKSEVPSEGRKLGNPIDRYIGSSLKDAGLEFSSEAVKETLIRRITLDLTGLPPSLDEVRNFVEDTKPNAWEKVVDRLLVSERFGELMAVYWMDAARYGDSSVMHADGPRDMWPWRDWVIRSFNENKPFDEFTIEQLAGDLLPNATVDQKVASAFNRNHATSDEGGAFAEELRVDYVVDRVMTTSRVWLALSMECSQCHDHKYDPISQKDYYSFFAYFNNTKDPGMQTRRGNQSPVVQVPTMGQVQELKEATAAFSSANSAVGDNKKKTQGAFAEWLKGAKADDEMALPELKGLAHHLEVKEEEVTLLVDGVTGASGVLKGELELTKGIASRKGLKFSKKQGIEFAGIPNRDSSKPFTMAAWVKVPTNGSGAVFSKMAGDGTYRGYDLWIQGRAVGTHIINKWPDSALKVVSREKLPADKWAHVVVSYDGSAKADGIAIYINGKLSKNQNEKNNLKGSIETDATFKVGKRTEGADFNGEVADIRIYDRKLSGVELKRLGANLVGKAIAKPADKRNKTEKALIDEFYYGTVDKRHPDLLAKSKRFKSTLDAVNKRITTCMVMEDSVDNPRMTYVLDRGQYDKPKKDEVIKPSVPEFLGELPEGAPANRLGLAQWLTRPDHPLTSRVAVNRLWGMYFGEGLVRSQGDFGNQGGTPTHPELLDWLAVDFVEHGWDVKRTIKQILMSATYKQSSRVTGLHHQYDPENLLVSRAPRFRLKGEFIRDQALSLSLLLEKTIGGPSVKPYQPDGLWNEVSLNKGLKFVRDKGEKLYRRSLYTYWKRSAPHPAMLIFDAPTREKCVVKRPRTNTPLQALVTLNDEQFVEASRRLAERIIEEGGNSFDSRLEYAFRLCTARSVSEQELNVCREVFTSQLKSFENDVDAVRSYLSIGDSKTRPEMQSSAELAAWTVLANMILNLDEVLTRG